MCNNKSRSNKRAPGTLWAKILNDFLCFLRCFFFRSGYSLHSRSTDGMERSVLANGNETISVLAFDWLTGNMYWGGADYIFVAPVSNMSKVLSLPLRHEAM